MGQVFKASAAHTAAVVAAVLVAVFPIGSPAQEAAAARVPQAKGQIPEGVTSNGYLLQRNRYRIVQEDYPDDGVVLGQGWDRFLNRKQLGVCVTGQVERLTGHTVDMKFRNVEDKEHVFDSLRVSASAKLSMGLTSLDGSASFSREVTVDSSELNILAMVSVDKGGFFLVPMSGAKADAPLTVSGGEIRLTEEARKLLKESGREGFRKMCGDAFVVGIRVGGELNGLLKWKVYSREEKRELEVELKAKGLWGSGEAKLNQNFQKKVSNNQLDFQFRQKGGDAANTPIDANTFVDKVKNFANPVGFDSRPYLIYTLDYCNVREFVACERDKITATPEAMNVWSSHYWRLMNLEKEYSRVLLNPSLYTFMSFGGDQSQPVDQAADTHDAIMLSAKFLDLVLAQCASNRLCDLEAALAKTLDELSGRRDEAGLTSDSSSYFLRSQNLDLVLQTTVGLENIAKVIGNAKPGARLPISEPLRLAAGFWLNNKFWLKTPAEASTASATIAPAGKKELDQILEGKFGDNGFDWYYYWLATKPIFRGGKFANEPVEIPAELNVKMFVTVAESNAAKTDDDFLKIYRPRYQTWLFQNRLFPISLSFCQVSAVHPMCMTTDRLKQIAAQVPIRQPVATLRPDQPPPPPPPPPAAKPPREPREPICGRHWQYC